MVLVIVVMVVGVAVAAALFARLIVIRRRRFAEERRITERAARSVMDDHPDPGPMTGLEDALNSLTDTEGRTMATRLDDESLNVEDLRVPDDTGPLLRRVLDSIESGGDQDDSTDSTDTPGS